MNNLLYEKVEMYKQCFNARKQAYAKLAGLQIAVENAKEELNVRSYQLTKADEELKTVLQSGG